MEGSRRGVTALDCLGSTGSNNHDLKTALISVLHSDVSSLPSKESNDIVEIIIIKLVATTKITNNRTDLEEILEMKRMRADEQVIRELRRRM